MSLKQSLVSEISRWYKKMLICPGVEHWAVHL